MDRLYSVVERALPLPGVDARLKLAFRLATALARADGPFVDLRAFLAAAFLAGVFLAAEALLLRLAFLTALAFRFAASVVRAVFDFDERLASVVRALSDVPLVAISVPFLRDANQPT